jgi:PGF-CTERM protein
MAAQPSDGHTVTIDRVDLAAGGFVVVHDASLFAGEVEGSVLGASAYLEPGVHEDVQVTLDTPANESQLLVPMAHRDTDGDETYEFPDADGPYTANGSAVVDTAEVSVTATVSVSDQPGGETVVVDSVTLADGGFVTIHDGNLQDGDVFESVRGTSAYLGPGTHTDVEVTLDDPYEASGTAIAMPHRDTDGNEAYDFVRSSGGDDGPYTADGAVVAAASVTVDDGMDATDSGSEETEMDEGTETEMDEGTETEMDEGTETEMDEGTETDDGTDGSTGTEMGDAEPTGTSSTSLPGFGVTVALLALLAAAFVARRR